MENTIKLKAPKAQVNSPSVYDPNSTILVCRNGWKLLVDPGVFKGLDSFEAQSPKNHGREIVRLWLNLRYGVAPTEPISMKRFGRLCELASAVGDTPIQRLPITMLRDAETNQERWQLLELFAKNFPLIEEQKANTQLIQETVDHLLGRLPQLEHHLQIGIWLCEGKLLASCSGVRALFRKIVEGAEDDLIKARANYQLALCSLEGIDGQKSEAKARQLLRKCPYRFAPAHLKRLQLGVPEKAALHILGMFEKSDDPALLFACARLAEHHSSPEVREAAAACQKRAEEKDSAI